MFVEVRNLNKHYMPEESSTPMGIKGFFSSFSGSSKIIPEGLHDISFCVQKGEFVSILGLKCSGKSTLLKILSGEIPPTSGIVTIKGKSPISAKKGELAISTYFHGKTNLINDQSVKMSFEAIKDFYRIPEQIFYNNLKIAIQILELNDVLDYPVSMLDNSRRVRCELAAAFLAMPELLLLDEPLRDLDEQSKTIVYKFLTKINHEAGITIIQTSRELGRIEKICNQLIILDNGYQIYEGNYTDICNKYGEQSTLIIDLANPYAHIEEINFKIVREEGNKKYISFNKNEISPSEIIQRLSSKHNIRNFTLIELELESVTRRIQAHTLTTGTKHGLPDRSYAPRNDAACFQDFNSFNNISKRNVEHFDGFENNNLGFDRNINYSSFDSYHNNLDSEYNISEYNPKAAFEETNFINQNYNNFDDNPGYYNSNFSSNIEPNNNLWEKSNQINNFDYPYNNGNNLYQTNNSYEQQRVDNSYKNSYFNPEEFYNSSMGFKNPFENRDDSYGMSFKKFDNFEPQSGSGLYSNSLKNQNYFDKYSNIPANNLIDEKTISNHSNYSGIDNYDFNNKKTTDNFNSFVRNDFNNINNLSRQTPPNSYSNNFNNFEQPTYGYYDVSGNNFNNYNDNNSTNIYNQSFIDNRYNNKNYSDLPPYTNTNYTNSIDSQNYNKFQNADYNREQPHNRPFNSYSFNEQNSFKQNGSFNNMHNSPNNAYTNMNPERFTLPVGKPVQERQVFGNTPLDKNIYEKPLNNPTNIASGQINSQREGIRTNIGNILHNQYKPQSIFDEEDRPVKKDNFLSKGFIIDSKEGKKLALAPATIAITLVVSLILLTVVVLFVKNSSSLAQEGDDTSSYKTSTTTSTSKDVPIVVENYKGKDLSLIEADLKNRNIKINVISKPSTLKKGTIISQDPKPGTTLNPASAQINLEVSTGSDASAPTGEPNRNTSNNTSPQKVRVPDVIGLTSTQAQEKLAQSKLIASPVKNPGDPDFVSSMEPAPGTLVDEGTSVKLYFLPIS